MVTIQHPLQAADREVMAAIRQAAAPSKGQLEQDTFDAMLEQTPAASGVIYDAAEVGGVPGWWCRPVDPTENTAILYLHGGAYAIGSARAFRHMAGQIAARAKAVTFVAEYRLSPRSPFPGAVEDALAAYKGLVAEGFTSIALAGDSAGGGLALVTLSHTVAEALHGTGLRPRGAAVMSPWTDLSLSGTSVETRAEADPFLTKAILAAKAHDYLGQQDARDPLASPLFGDRTDLPPVMLHVGEDEILLDDSRRYAERFAAKDEESQLHIWAGMPHVFASSIGTLAAAEMALDDIGTFLFQQLHNKR